MKNRKEQKFTHIIDSSLQRAAANVSPPPFELLTERINARQPVESYEQFFDGDADWVQDKTPTVRSGTDWRGFFGLAAAIMLFVAGGAVITTLIGGLFMRCGSAAPTEEAVEYSNQAMYDMEAMADDTVNESSDKCVSDSDWCDSETDDTDSTDSSSDNDK